MPEYTVISIISIIAAVVLDILLKTRIFLSIHFWIFMTIMMLAEFIVNGFLTSVPVFLYGEQFVSGIYLRTVPIEDFFLGFSFISFVIILWEKLTTK